MTKIYSAIELLLLELKDQDLLDQVDVKEVSELLRAKLKKKIIKKTNELTDEILEPGKVKIGYPGVNLQ